MGGQSLAKNMWYIQEAPIDQPSSFHGWEVCAFPLLHNKWSQMLWLTCDNCLTVSMGQECGFSLAKPSLQDLKRLPWGCLLCCVSHVEHRVLLQVHPGFWQFFMTVGLWFCFLALTQYIHSPIHSPEEQIVESMFTRRQGSWGHLRILHTLEWKGENFWVLTICTLHSSFLRIILWMVVIIQSHFSQSRN